MAWNLADTKGIARVALKCGCNDVLLMFTIACEDTHHMLQNIKILCFHFTKILRSIPINPFPYI